MANLKKAGNSKKVGRPPKRLSPKTPLAKRLQDLFGASDFGKIGEIMGVGRDSARKYLAGERTPGSDVLARVVQATGCDPTWLLMGNDDEGATAPRSSRAQAAESTGLDGAQRRCLSLLLDHAARANETLQMVEHFQRKVLGDPDFARVLHAHLDRHGALPPEDFGG